MTEIDIDLYEKFTDLRSLVDSLANDHEAPYFILDPYDESMDYCWDCLQKKLIANPEDDYGGGYVMESDSARFCEECGKRLGYTLTNYGVESELEHFSENPPSSSDLEDGDVCYELTRIAWGICDDDAEKIAAFVALFPAPPDADPGE